MRLMRGFTINLRRFGRWLGVNSIIRPVLDLGGYQAKVDRLMLAHVGAGDVFWDIGANQGDIIKAILQKFHNDVTIVAFEPHPKLAGQLREYQCDTCRIVEAAVSDKTGVVHFSYGDDLLQTTGSISEFGAPNIDQTVKVQSVDVLYSLTELLLPSPHVIKVDVEGSELEVLRSIEKALPKLSNLRSIFIEVHFSILDERGKTEEFMQKLNDLTDHGSYRSQWLDVSHVLLVKE